MPKKVPHLIPNEVLIPAANATLLEFIGHCNDHWERREKEYCKEKCGPGYAHISIDWIQKRVTTLRKAGKLISPNGGPKRPVRKGM